MLHNTKAHASAIYIREVYTCTIVLDTGPDLIFTAGQGDSKSACLAVSGCITHRFLDYTEEMCIDAGFDGWYFARLLKRALQTV